MIKYNNSNINDWNFGDDNIAKVYYGVTESSRLPNGYTEVEYISNYSGGTATPTSTTKNGLAYIDTNFIPTEKTRTVADLQVTQASQNPRYFGSGKWNSLGYIVSQEWTVGESRARIYCKYGQSSEWIQTDYVPTMDRHVYDLNNDGKMLIDNVEIATLPTTSFTCATSMAIFTATRANDTYVDLGETVFGRCYSFKIYEDGILVRDFVPCTRDSDSKAGMYDIVNDVFYSSGNDNNLYAGNAIYHSTVGNVVYQKVINSVTPTPPSPSRLPSGYTEVEYVENTGTSFINLNTTPYSSTSNSFNVECTFYSYAQSNLSYLISCENALNSPYYGFVARYNGGAFKIEGGSIGVDTTGVITDKGNGVSSFTISSISTTTNNNDTPITLFCGLNGNASWRYCKGRLYSLTMILNNTKIRDLIPCTRDSDSKAGVYDIVNDVFYSSASNDELVAGPIV